MNKNLIKICYQKLNNEIKGTWDELAILYDYKSGEALRSKFKKYRKERKELNNVETRILCLSDLHYPYNIELDFLHEYRHKTDILLINGDEQDCELLSKYDKTYRCGFDEEIIGCRQMLIDIINSVKPKKVIFNHGNHNLRFINYFKKRIHESLLIFFPETNLSFICDNGIRFHNHKSKDKTETFYKPLKEIFDIPIEYTKSFYCKIGKTIFAHPKACKQGILGTAEKAYLYFKQNEEDFSSLVLAHTHQVGIYKYGKCLLYEQGSLCKEPSYSTDGSLMRLQGQGFIYICQDSDGKLIYDKTKLVIL